MRRASYCLPLASILILLPMLFGCGSSSAAPTATNPTSVVSISLSDASVTLGAGETYQLTATVTGTSNSVVTWGLSGCHWSFCGTISSTGLYTAPSPLPEQGSVTVTATSQADPAKSAGCLVTLMPITVSITPLGPWVAPGAQLDFTGSVQYDVKNAGVTWALAPGCSAATCGSLSNVTASSVTYTAPATVPSPPTVALIATSVTDPSKTAQITITIAVSSAWYVDGVNGNDKNDCKSFGHACKTIGHAISLCSPGDSIMVAPATYKETLAIRISLNIVGSSAATAIVDGRSKVGSVFTVSRSMANVHLSNLTIRNGAAPASYGLAGGIYNQGTLTVSNGIISGNSGHVGGILNGGTLTINNSTISGNEAGSSQYGDSGHGGGIDNDGTLTINNSTISGNVANSGSGGGILNGGTLTINNSTISGNSADFGGGIDGTATLQNTIVVNNSATTGANCSGSVTSKGYNLSSDSTCNFNGPGDLNNIDPKLGALGNYGGPTPTIPLLAGSPAIDAGNPKGCTDSNGHLLTTDQRGYPRPDAEDKTGCDMGAYEGQSD